MTHLIGHYIFNVDNFEVCASTQTSKLNLTFGTFSGVCSEPF